MRDRCVPSGERTTRSRPGPATYLADGATRGTVLGSPRCGVAVIVLHGSPPSNVLSPRADAPERGELGDVMTGGRQSSSVRRRATSSRQRRQRQRVDRLMLPGSTTKVAGPSLRTLPTRAWYASKSATTRLVPFESNGFVVTPPRRRSAAISRAVSGSPAARRMPMTARRRSSPEIACRSTPQLGMASSRSRQLLVHL